jgi:putative ABC transport system permease protein
MKNKDLGFKKDNLLLCNVFGDGPDKNFDILRTELLRNPDIVDATISINAPFNGNWGKEINWESAPPDEKIGICFNAVGYDFINTYKMQLKLGRDFSREFSTDSGACIINETAMQQIGWKNPIGKRIDNNRYTIIGVVKDFHPFSVHVKIPPFYMTLNSGNLKEGGLYAVRIKPGSRDRVTSYVNQQFHNFFPDAIIQVANFDKDLQYGTEDVWEIVEKVFFAFAVIAVLIAANGLFGLISFAAQRRIKEIGVRKVLGANVPGLYVMMSKEFLYILLIAVIVALPSGYIVAVTTPGAYKYKLQPGDYLLAVGLMFITAFAATVYHTTKAVLSNPVESLKYE